MEAPIASWLSLGRQMNLDRKGRLDRRMQLVPRYRSRMDLVVAVVAVVLGLRMVVAVVVDSKPEMRTSQIERDD